MVSNYFLFIYSSLCPALSCGNRLFFARNVTKSKLNSIKKLTNINHFKRKMLYNDPAVTLRKVTKFDE
jgi:hypothetical protein